MKIVISPYSNKLSTKINPKNYPDQYWEKLVHLLQNEGHEIWQIGMAGEKLLVPAGYVRQNLKMPQLKEFIQDIDLYFSVDNFFPHFAWHYGKYGVVLWGPSDPKLWGYKENLNLFKDEKYFRHDQYGLWESCERIEEAFVDPEAVMKAIQGL